MNRSTPVLASLVASLTLAGSLVACGGGGSGSFDKPSDALNSSIDALCAKAYDCMSSYDASMHNGTAFSGTYGTSQDGCVTMEKALITAFLGANYLAELDASASAGRITYSSADAQACFDAEDAETCDQFFMQNGATFTDPQSCDDTLVGTVATGSACTIDQDCATAGDTCTSMVCTTPTP